MRPIRGPRGEPRCARWPGPGAGEREALARACAVPQPARVRRPRPAREDEDEVVLVMGIPGAGKSRIAREYVERGHARLNRDERGGSLRALAGALEHELS